MAVVGAYWESVGIGSVQGAAYFYEARNLNLALDTPSRVKKNDEYTSDIIATNSATVVTPDVTAEFTVPESSIYISSTPSQGTCTEVNGEQNNHIVCDFGKISGNDGTANASIVMRAVGDYATEMSSNAAFENATPALTITSATQVNTPPSVEGDIKYTNENNPVMGDLSFSDADGDPVTLEIVDSPLHGTVTIGTCQPVLDT